MSGKTRGSSAGNIGKGYPMSYKNDMLKEREWKTGIEYCKYMMK